MTQTDAAGTEFNPAIHAVKKDGSPKRTPQGTWALLVDAAKAEAPEQSGEGATITITTEPHSKSVGAQVALALGARLVHDGGNHITIERNGQQISVNTAKGADAAIRGLRRCGW